MINIRIFVWIFLGFLVVGCAREPDLPTLSPDAVLLAFGDSLTHGTGAAEQQSYPAHLQRLIDHRVINAGVPGEISAEGLRRLPRLLDEQQPDLLLLCHGGNDLLRKLDRGQLKENLRQMLAIAGQRQIPVVLIAVPQPSLLLDDATLYRELATEWKIPLLDDTLADLLADRRFKSDQIHPNAAGYGRLAAAVAALLHERGAL